MQVLPQLSPGQKLWVIAVGSMVTQQREFNALNKVPHMLVRLNLITEDLDSAAQEVKACRTRQPRNLIDDRFAN